MMKATDLLTAFEQSGKRTHLVGDLQAGVIIALDMEGRLFTVKDGLVLNRVNPKAVAGQSTQTEYLNPGGDGLWPAPEGKSMGYQYATGVWRTPSGLSSARYLLSDTSRQAATIRGEIDLINASGWGIPTIFERRITVSSETNSVRVQVRESIAYIGSRELKAKDCLLAPWTLCQFDSGQGAEVVFPYTSKSGVWDLYDESSADQRKWAKDLCHIAVDGAMKYQIGIDAATPWIEYRDPGKGLTVRRSTNLLPEGHSYIDIRDADPSVPPSSSGVRYSVYSDPALLMEIEAAGGCPASLLPGSEMSIEVTTVFQVNGYQIG